MENSVEKAGATSIAEEFIDRVRKENRTEQIKQYMPFVIFSCIIIVACFAVPSFFSLNNFRTLLSQIAVPLICATGMTFILLIGGMDLSMEGVIGFCGVVLSYLVANSKTSLNLGLLGVLITIAAGSTVGLITGLIHTKLRLPSFIVTYAVGIIFTGFSIMIYRGAPAAVSSNLVLSLTKNFLGLPILTWLALAIFTVAAVVLKYTTFGRSIYAIGDNEMAIRAAGINVDRAKLIAFVICATCASFAGIIGVSRLKYGDISVGRNRIFSAITACVVGGTSLSGGKGGMLQCLMGVMIVTVLGNILILLGVDTDYQDAIEGVIVIVSVIISTVRNNKTMVK